MTRLPRVGVIGTGAMGLGVVQSLVRGGFDVRARDIRESAQSGAVRAGALAAATPATLADECDIVIVVVVDAPQVEVVLFGDQGAAPALARDSVVMLCSTVAPAFVAGVARRLRDFGVALLDAPVSGGPQRALDGTMTMMISGDAGTICRCSSVLPAISGRHFVVGAHAGMAATVKVLNNQLAAANLAAGAEAMALATLAGIDVSMLLEVMNASSGASWIVDDRMRRRLQGDAEPRAAMTLLAKDSGIAVEAAAMLGFDAPLARAAHDAFIAAVRAGYAQSDDSALVDYYLRDRTATASRNDLEHR
ncbi:MAG TPA: NAD(P)-binding domain-containing protein [Casimicrobiaceae bacterium]